MKTNTFSARSSLSMVGVALSWAALSLGGCALATDDQAAAESDREAVAEAQQALTTNFPGSLTATLGASTMAPFEPSGLARHSGVLYMASDNGKIGKYDPATSKWTTEISTTGDFESLTEANNGQLMVGVEGTSNNNASIAKVDLGSKSIGRSWKLNNVSGMEAMTFVPEAYTPFGPANTAAHPSDFAGYFFITTQNDLGRISVYRLDSAPSTGTWIADYDIDIDLQGSDISFANGVLYVLFDDHNTSDLIGVYVINTNPSNQMLAFQKQYALPNVNGTDVNYEAITFDGQTIYLGRDNNANSSDDGVYEFDHTLMYPQAVLPPLSW